MQLKYNIAFSLSVQNIVKIYLKKQSKKKCIYAVFKADKIKTKNDCNYTVSYNLLSYILLGCSYRQSEQDWLILR